MTIVQYGLLVLGIVATILLVPPAAGACPKCFESADPQVLRTYYLSALLLSTIPFGIIGSILGWLFIHHKRQAHRSKEGQDNQSKACP